MEISREQYRKLLILAKRTMHTAHVWNDHNFVDSAYKLAKQTTASVGITSYDEANNFLEGLPDLPVPTLTEELT